MPKACVSNAPGKSIEVNSPALERLRASVVNVARLRFRLKEGRTRRGEEIKRNSSMLQPTDA
jgi:hypothetical protein